MVDRPVHLRPLEGHRDVFGRLEDLERELHVHDARHAGQVAVGHRIGRRPVRDVLGPLHRRPRLIRNRAALHDARSSRHPVTCHVPLEVGRRPIAHLPDPLQIRLALGGPGYRHFSNRWRTGAGCRARGEHGDAKKDEQVSTQGGGWDHGGWGSAGGGDPVGNLMAAADHTSRPLPPLVTSVLPFGNRYVPRPSAECRGSAAVGTIHRSTGWRLSRPTAPAGGDGDNEWRTSLV